MFDMQEELKNVPGKPGVYLMKDRDDRIIYVGKARVLKNRLRQYFQPSVNLSPRIRAMVSIVEKFEYIITDTEVEALVLEYNMIKKHSPRFNVLMKDDKSYPYIKLTLKEQYPRVFLTRRKTDDGSKYFGPYTSGAVVRETLSILKRIFPLKQCKKVFPRDAGRDRPCLNFHIKQCLAPCRGGVSREEYKRMLDSVSLFLSGKYEPLVNKMKQEMEEASAGMDFEKAAVLRDRISAVKKVVEKQKVALRGNVNADILGLGILRDRVCVEVFFIRNGRLTGREQLMLDGQAGSEESEIMASFISQFYMRSPGIPPVVYTSIEADGVGALEEWLSGLRGTKVRIKVPVRGDKKGLMEMALENARIALAGSSFDISDEVPERLMKALQMDSKPRRIEAFDISNISGMGTVASMVVFDGNKPDKSGYRRFKIRSERGRDDTASIKEVISRRLRRIKPGVPEPENGDTATDDRDKMEQAPDLILVDGGKGQVSAATGVMRELGLNIPVAGMVKDDRHRTRGLIRRDKVEIDLVKDQALLRYIAIIQGEAHRFAVEYHRKLRRKGGTRSILDEIDGIGEKRRKALIRHFGSIKAISKADVEELKSVKGMNELSARAVYGFFR